MPDDNPTPNTQPTPSPAGLLSTWQLTLLGIYVAFWIFALTVGLLKVLNASPVCAANANQNNTNQAATPGRGNTNGGNNNASNSNGNGNSSPANANLANINRAAGANTNTTVNSNSATATNTNSNVGDTSNTNPSNANLATTTPTPPSNCDRLPVRVIGTYTWTVTPEVQRVLLVLLAGALGALIHVMRSFIYHTGIGDFKSDWTWFYLFHALTGSTLALGVYMVIRGGFLQTAQQVDPINPFSFTALAIIVGAFSDNAWTKLKQIAETVFTPSDREQKITQPPPTTPTIKSISPAQGQQNGGEEVDITGEGFTATSTVKFGDALATVVSFVGGTLKVLTPKAAAPGPVNVVVSTGTKQSQPVQFTYV